MTTTTKQTNASIADSEHDLTRQFQESATLLEELRAEPGHSFGFHEGAVEGEAKGRARGLAERKAELEIRDVTKSSIKGQAEGRKRGRDEGRAEGLKRGRAEGRTQGREQGENDGLPAGEINERISTLKLVLADSDIRLSAEDISCLRILNLEDIPTITAAKSIKSSEDLWRVVERSIIRRT